MPLNTTQHNKRRYPEKGKEVQPQPKRGRCRPKNVAHGSMDDSQAMRFDHHNLSAQPTLIGKGGRVLYRGRDSKGASTSRGAFTSRGASSNIGGGRGASTSRGGSGASTTTNRGGRGASTPQAEVVRVHQPATSRVLRY